MLKYHFYSMDKTKYFTVLRHVYFYSIYILLAWVCLSTFYYFIFQSTCTLNYSYVYDTAGYYGVAIQIEDFANSFSTTPLSSIPLQFLVEVFTSSSACASAPTFISPTPPNGGCYEAIQGVTLTIEIRIRTGTTSQK